jgi:hypothetical protein
LHNHRENALDTGVRCGFSSIVLASRFSYSQAASTLAAAPVAQSVGQPKRKISFYNFDFGRCKDKVLCKICLQVNLSLAIRKRSTVNNIKFRLFAFAIIAISSGMTYYNWIQLNTEGRYSMKVAVFAPIGVIGGIFLLLFPESGGKPQTTSAKIIAMLIFGIGIAAGLYNLFLMDPSRFGK